jgi:uncharacterized protein YjbJ (UPF0337 family)
MGRAQPGTPLTRALDRGGRDGQKWKPGANEGASQQAQGRLKEAIGALTGNRRQASQGRADQGRGRLRERWGHLKDALHR